MGLGSLNPVRIVQGKGEIGEALGPLAPVLAGAALGPAGFGLMSAGMAGLTVGGITALASGNLEKGLMAGLGAYGGAGISSGLSNLGAAEATAAANPQLAASEIGREMGTAGFAQPSATSKLTAGLSEAFASPKAGLAALGQGSMLQGAGVLGAAALPLMAGSTSPTVTPMPNESLIRPYTFSRQQLAQPNMVQASYQPGQDTSERRWFDDAYTALTPYKAPGAEYKMAGGGPIEAMSNANAIGMNTGYPQADIQGHAYATPWQDPVSTNMVTGAADTGVNRITGEMSFAAGGLGSLGGYSDGGRMLKGPGDGMSDSIPARIAGRQPARLANEEFVIPADVVSHLGNGSSESGAKQLYKMMDRVRMARTGNKKQGKQINPRKLMPA
jgi:hypothetical protein